METITLNLRFKGIDDWNQPIFKSDNGRFYGTNDVLFGYGAKADEVIKEIEDKNIRLVYFGTHFNCEPMGTPLKKEVKIVFTDKENTK